MWFWVCHFIFPKAQFSHNKCYNNKSNFIEDLCDEKSEWNSYIYICMYLLISSHFDLRALSYSFLVSLRDMTTPKSVWKWKLHISEGLTNGSVQTCCDITTYWTSVAFSILTSQKLNSSPFLWKPVCPSRLNKWYNRRFNHKTGILAANLILSLFLSPTSNYL